jgi:hypothetical protein
VERFDETDHMLGWSFRGATEGGEHGIHSPRPVGYGFRARRFAAPRGANGAVREPHHELGGDAVQPRDLARQGSGPGGQR